MKRIIVLLIFSALLVGCDGVKQDVSNLISEALKSSEQKQAEQMCVQAAYNEELKRTTGLKELLGTPAETQTIGKNHFLVRIIYKLVTIDDPGTTSRDLSMYGGVNCEVNQGRVVDGRLDNRL